MEREEQIKVAITAGIVAVILLILVLFLALSGRNKGDDQRPADDTVEYASMDASGSNQGADTASSAGSSDNPDSSSDNSISEADTASSGKSTVQYSEYLQTAKGDVSGNGFYATTGPLLKDVYKNVSYDKQAQLQEMLTYWQDGNTDAVRDLAHLDRFEAMSYSLKGTSDFYYLGDVNDQGLPEGKGLAVYTDNQYYYGDWSQGLRSGEGSWFCFYPGYSTYVVTEHMYTGSWKDDKPEGEGQEHFDYNPDYMNSDDVYLQNAIGNFVGGLYNGDMYIIDVDMNGNCTEWLGKCVNGSLQRVEGMSDDKKGNMPVLKKRQEEQTVFYMAKSKNKDLGVKGLLTGGTIRK